VIGCEDYSVISNVSKGFPYKDQIEELVIVIISICVFSTRDIFSFQSTNQSVMSVSIILTGSFFLTSRRLLFIFSHRIYTERLYDELPVKHLTSQSRPVAPATSISYKYEVMYTAHRPNAIFLYYPVTWPCYVDLDLDDVNIYVHSMYEFWALCGYRNYACQFW